MVFFIENDSHLKSSEEALTHLEEVIAQVVNEAVEYADKPPEERTLPALVRKSVTQPRRPNPAPVYGQVNMPNNGAQMMGFNQMGAYGFQQAQCNPRFASKSPFVYLNSNFKCQLEPRLFNNPLLAS